MTDLTAPPRIRRWLLIAAAAAALTGCQNDPVERGLVGTWQAAVASPTGAVQLRFTTLSNGQYRIDFVGLGALQMETGYFTAADGEWRKENITGGIEQGTYEFLGDDSVLFQGAASGPVVWARAADAMPATPPAPTASRELTAPPLAPAAAIAAGAPMPAAPQDVLSAGPFGPALAPAPFETPANDPTVAPAAFSAPNTAGMPFGSPQATPFGSPAASSAPLFAPPPEIVAIPGGANSTSSLSAVPAQAAQNAISGGTRAVTNLDRGALADLPQQTLNDLEGSARQTAAGVVDEAAAEAERKVGERIRNFFRRDRQRDEEDQQ